MLMPQALLTRFRRAQPNWRTDPLSYRLALFANVTFGCPIWRAMEVGYQPVAASSSQRKQIK